MNNHRKLCVLYITLYGELSYHSLFFLLNKILYQLALLILFTMLACCPKIFLAWLFLYIPIVVFSLMYVIRQIDVLWRILSKKKTVKKI